MTRQGLIYSCSDDNTALKIDQCSMTLPLSAMLVMVNSAFAIMQTAGTSVRGLFRPSLAELLIRHSSISYGLPCGHSDSSTTRDLDLDLVLALSCSRQQCIILYPRSGTCNGLYHCRLHSFGYMNRTQEDLIIISEESYVDHKDGPWTRASGRPMLRSPILPHCTRGLQTRGAE